MASDSDFDESTANPDPALSRRPPRVEERDEDKELERVVESAAAGKLWEDFDRKIYGRGPRGGPAAKWVLVNRASQEEGAPLITNQLGGYVDNSSYLLTAVDIHLSLSTPCKRLG